MRTGILAQILAREGHEVVWWTSAFDHYNRRHRFRKDTRKIVESEFSIHYIRARGYQNNMSLARLRDARQIANRFAELARLDNHKPDVIVASIPSAEMAAEAVRIGIERQIPTVIDVRDLWPDLLYERFPKWGQPALRLLLKGMEQSTHFACARATAITGITEHFVDWGVDWAGRPRGRHDQAFAMAYLRRAPAADELNKARQFWDDQGIKAESGSLIIAFFGTLGHMFDMKPVIDAARILEVKAQKVRFIFCGDGECAASIRKYAQGVGNITFPGWVRDAEIRALLERAQIGLAPYIDSPNFVNNIANKPGEYLSGGLPVAVSLSRGPLKELVETRACGFSYHRSAERLAQELLRYLKDGELLERQAENARRVFESQLDGDVVYPKMIEFLQTLVHEYQRRSPNNRTTALEPPIW